jgi:hypothetical protein
MAIALPEPESQYAWFSFPTVDGKSTLTERQPTLLNVFELPENLSAPLLRKKRRNV